MPATAQAHIGMRWLLDPTTPRYEMSGFILRWAYFKMFLFRESVCNGWSSSAPRYHFLSFNI